MSSDRRLSPRVAVSGVALVALGVVARCVRWRNVFTSHGIELVPSDSHYYIRFAQRALAQFPCFDRFDPYVNFPTGAEILWPPLHTWTIAAFLKFGPLDPERAAAFVDPTIAAVEMAILGLIALSLLGRTAAATVLLLFALTPGCIFTSPLGCADHHVHEPFFAALSCLLLAAAIERRSVRMTIATGAALGASRLFTPLEPLLIVPIATALMATAVFFRRDNVGRAVAQLALATGASAAGVLSLSVLVFGNVRSMEYEFLTPFHPLFALVLFSTVAFVARILVGDRRWWEPLLLAVACAVPLIPQLFRAISHMGRADPILTIVDESQPLGLLQARDLMSALIIAGPMALVGAVRMLRARSAAVTAPLVASIILLAPALQQNRFVQAFLGALIVLVAMALPALFEGQPRAEFLRRAANFVGGGVLLYSLVPPPLAIADTDVKLIRPTMRWIRDHTPPPSADPLGDAKPDYAIVANPMVGHFLNLWAERPDVANPFSQAPAHLAGNERVAKIFSATSEEDVYRQMVATGGRYLLLTPLLQPISNDRNRVDVEHTFVTGLFESPHPDTAHFKLIYESTEQQMEPGVGSYARVFEVLPAQPSADGRGQHP